MRKLLSLLVMLGIAIFVAAPVMAKKTTEKPPAVESFTLTDHTGKTVTEKSYPDKYLLVYFGFTYCPDICPTELQTAANALDLIPPALAAKVQPLFITIDPARDTPAIMAEYVSMFGDNFVGLTGTPEQIAAVAKLYHITYAKSAGDNEGADYMLDYTSHLTLVAPDGHFVKTFPSGVSADALATQLKTNLR